MNQTAYINILKDTLGKKVQLLDELLAITNAQEQAISLKEADMEEFESGVEKKAPLIKQLTQLDDGFETIYEKIGKEIKENSTRYQKDITELQDCIRQIMDKSALLQGKERENKQKFDNYLSRRKKEVRNFKVSNQAVGNYYKSMSENHQGESVFLDKKK